MELRRLMNQVLLKKGIALPDFPGNIVEKPEKHIIVITVSLWVPLSEELSAFLHSHTQTIFLEFTGTHT